MHFPIFLGLVNSALGAHSRVKMSFLPLLAFSINLERTLCQIKDNDSMLTKININNIKNIPRDVLVDYCEALKTNETVTSWTLASTGITDTVAFAIAEMLKVNKTLKILNIESNFITGEGIIAIMNSLEKNDCLQELRISNQRAQFGSKVETKISSVLSKNTTLQKFGYYFRIRASGLQVTRYLLRNNNMGREKMRKRRGL